VIGALAVALAACALGCGADDRPAAPPRDTSTVVFADSFESGTLDRWEEVQRARRRSIRVVEGRARDGRRAARFALRAGDRIAGETDARAELAQGGDPLGEGDEREYRWSTFVPERYPRSRRWQVIAQWKNEGEGSPPLELDLIGEDVVLTGHVDGRGIELGRAPLVRGRWLDFHVRIRFSERARDAAIELRLRGAPVALRREIPTLYPGRTSYFKLGLYRDGAIEDAASLYHDAVQVRRP
jgi:hypothetical protein